MIHSRFFKVFLAFIFWIFPKEWKNLCFSPKEITEFYSKKGRYNIDRIFVSSSYTKEIQELLRAYKYERKRGVGHDLVHGYFSLFSFLQEAIKNEKCIITAIPIGFDRYISRGFNQSVFFAKTCAKKWKIPYKRLLFSSLSFDHQARKTKKERLQRKNPFHLVPFQKNSLIGSTIILFDDVISTGTTLYQAAEILKKYGAKKIIALCLSRGG